MFRALAALVTRDNDLPARAHTIDVLTRFLDGEIYDVLPHEFHEERDDGARGEYIPIAKRAPSVQSGILATVVNDSVSFLFSDGRFPEIVTDETGTEKPAADTVASIIKDTKLNAVMLEAARTGSVGSVCVWVRVLKARLFFETLNTKYLTPTFDPNAPDTLAKVREQYKTTGAALRDLGYEIPDDSLKTKYWFTREWDSTAETWFLPRKVGEQGGDVIDTTRTVKHSLGFVPMIWILNLPGGNKIDGRCTFKPAIETAIEADYQLSQAGRGLKYSSSPTLAITTDGEAPQNKAVGDTLIIPADGKAELLEIEGGAAKAALEFAQGLRELALESVGGSRADANKLSAATSGRAMEMMNQSLIWLADKLRISYGEGALLKLLKMLAKISRQVSLKDSDGGPLGKIPEGVKLSLKWPAWYAPTSDDRNADATALTTLVAGGIMSAETATGAIAGEYDIEDLDAELAKIKGEAAEKAKAELALAVAAPPQTPAK